MKEKSYCGFYEITMILDHAQNKQLEQIAEKYGKDERDLLEFAVTALPHNIDILLSFIEDLLQQTEMQKEIDK